jgi:hypothetical protein
MSFDPQGTNKVAKSRGRKMKLFKKEVETVLYIKMMHIFFVILFKSKYND